MTDTDTIQLAEFDPAHAVVLSRTVSSAGLSAAVTSALARVRSLTTAARVLPVGPPFVRYVRWGEDAEIEVGVPLAQPEAVPGLRSTIVPGGPAATTWHEGSHEEITPVLAALEDWIAAHATPAGSPWASFGLADDSGPRTLVVWPVKALR